MYLEPIIFCDICGHTFKTYSKKETHYSDLAPYEELCYYPLESENAHLIKNYICEDCYNKLPLKVKSQILESLRNSINAIDEEYSLLEKKYLNSIKEIKNKENKLNELYKTLQKTEMLNDLSKDIKKYLFNNNEVYLRGSFYLEEAIKWEKERYLKQKPLLEWEKYFNVSVSKYPNTVSRYDWATKEEFLNYLLDCEVSNKTTRELLDLIKKG